ncbi:Eisosome component PIL1-domain-containing protein [Fomitopsis serialis]|uniref:Eisosome component PIL1-domain-containing protein n=1 Tax=Fomitopsis serialis TaxID=139415 RepID=UPI00200844F1|nr:Eisosome component PIL1-domain-containing protein [Neoantrodia serialis]KAH9937119.1 Eisosome component PIL1-domain-containing protein [Neoantrodia serialis]
MSEFLSSLKGKAQSAFSSAQAGLTGPADAASGQGGGILKSHAFESIHHQLRSFQQQYSSSVTPIQRIITTQKGIALDYDGIAGDTQAHSKELYMWGQSEEPDIKDVTDRLGWINFIEGALARTLAGKINASRATFKVLRDSENTLNGRRTIRAGLQNQIARLEHDQSRGYEQKIAELKQQLAVAEAEDQPLELEYELLKRKAIRDSERAKWEATREYAEKLMLLSQAATAVLQALPSVPPADKQYHGAEATTSVRATLQYALDNYKPGDITLPLSTSPADLSRSDTRSFGQTHAHELAKINTTGTSSAPSIPVTPPPTAVGHAPPATPSNAANSPVSYAALPPTNPPRASPPGVNTRISPTTKASSPPLAPIPSLSATGATSAVVAPNPADPSLKVPSSSPTVAETGVPKSSDPGPASGNIRDLKQPSPPSATAKSPLYGQDTKGPYGTDAVPSGGSTLPPPADEKPQKWESADDEKKRLEREERERVLASGGGGSTQRQPDEQDGDEDLPPYQEIVE